MANGWRIVTATRASGDRGLRHRLHVERAVRLTVDVGPQVVRPGRVERHRHDVDAVLGQRRDLTADERVRDARIVRRQVADAQDHHMFRCVSTGAG